MSFKVGRKRRECLASLLIRRSVNYNFSIRVTKDPGSGIELADDEVIGRWFRVFLSTTNRWRTVELSDVTQAILILLSGELNIIFRRKETSILARILWHTSCAERTRSGYNGISMGKSKASRLSRQISVAAYSKCTPPAELTPTKNLKLWN